MNVAVDCSSIEFPEKMIKIYVLAVLGLSAAVGTGEVGGYLETLAYVLDVRYSPVHHTVSLSISSLRFKLKHGLSLLSLESLRLPLFVVFADTVYLWSGLPG